MPSRSSNGNWGLTAWLVFSGSTDRAAATMRKIGTTGSMAPQLTTLWPRSKSTSLLRCSVRRELRSFSGYRSLGHRAVLNPGPPDSRLLCSRIFRSELALFYSLSWINSSENAYWSVHLSVVSAGIIVQRLRSRTLPERRRTHSPLWNRTSVNSCDIRGGLYADRDTDPVGREKPRTSPRR